MVRQFLCCPRRFLSLVIVYSADQIMSCASANVLEIRPPHKRGLPPLFGTIGSALLGEALAEEDVVEPFVLWSDERTQAPWFVDATDVPGEELQRIFHEPRSAREIVVYGYDQAGRDHLRGRADPVPPSEHNLQSLAVLWFPPGELFTLPPGLQRLVLAGECVYAVTPPKKPPSSKRKTHLTFASFQSLCNDPEVIQAQWSRFQEILRDTYESVGVVRLVLPARCLKEFRSRENALRFQHAATRVLEVYSTEARKHNFSPLYVDCTEAISLLLLNASHCRVPVQAFSITPPPGRTLMLVPPRREGIMNLPEIAGVLEPGVMKNGRRVVHARNVTQQFFPEQDSREEIAVENVTAEQAEVVTWQDDPYWSWLNQEEAILLERLFGMQEVGSVPPQQLPPTSFPRAAARFPPRRKTTRAKAFVSVSSLPDL